MSDSVAVLAFTEALMVVQLVICTLAIRRLEAVVSELISRR